MKLPSAFVVCVGAVLLAPAAADACSNLWSTGRMELLDGERPGCATFRSDEGEGHDEVPVLGVTVSTACPLPLEVEVLDCPECEGVKVFPGVNLDVPRSERTRFGRYDLGIDVGAELGETFVHTLRWAYDGEEGTVDFAITVTDEHPYDQEVCESCSVGGGTNGAWALGILVFLGCSRRRTR